MNITPFVEPTDFGEYEATGTPLTAPTIKIKTLDEVFDLEPQWGGQVVECEEDGKLYQYVGWQELEIYNPE
jgi:hypothetical protein